MREDRAILPTLVALATLLIASPPAHSDEVNLSRNRVTATMFAQISAFPIIVFQAVDPTFLSNSCDDGDGCTVRLQMIHGGGGFRGDERVLFKNNNQWLTAGEPSVHFDADNDERDVILLAIGGDSCDFSDVDVFHGI